MRDLTVSPGGGIVSGVKITWSAPSGRTPQKYHVVGTMDGTTVVRDQPGVTETSTSMFFGAYELPPPVTVTVTAVYSDGSSEAVTAHGQPNPATCTQPGSPQPLRGAGGALAGALVALPQCAPPPQCQTEPTRPGQPSSPYCSVVAYAPQTVNAGGLAGDATRGVAEVSSGAATRSAHPAAGEADTGGRYAAAAGLVALAGLIRFGRYRMDADEREETRAERRSRSGRGRHQ